MDTHRFELTLLGPPRLAMDGEAVRVPRRKSLALLMYLAVERRAISRNRLAQLLWPDHGEEAARVSLRRALSDLNALLGPAWSEADADTVRLTPGFPLRTDLLELSATVQRDAERDLRQLETMLASWCRPFAEGFELAGCDTYEDWSYFHRESARRLQNLLYALACEAAERQGDGDRWQSWAAAWLARAPLDEAAARSRMRALASVGAMAEALAVYDELGERLADELGVSPEAATTAAWRQLAEGRMPASEAAPVIPVMRDAPVRYARSGDIHLAYRILGDAEPAVVLVPGFISHLEFMVQDPDISRWFSRLAAGRRALVFDKRGMGLSDRTGAPPSPEETAGDVLAIMDHAGIERAFLIGVSEGGPAAIACAHRAGNRVRGLVLYGTACCWVARPDYPHSIPREVYRRWLRWMEDSWGEALNVREFAPSRAGDSHTAHWWARLLRAGASPGGIRAIFKAVEDADQRTLLPRILCPALVLHRTDDLMIRRRNGVYLAEHLPHARYVEFPGQDHWFWAGDYEPMLDEIDRFIGAHP